MLKNAKIVIAIGKIVGLTSILNETQAQAIPPEADSLLNICGAHANMNKCGIHNSIPPVEVQSAQPPPFYRLSPFLLTADPTIAAFPHSIRATRPASPRPQYDHF